MSTDGEIREHYGRGEERDRLLSPFGQVEFARTCEIVERHLPPAPAVVADIGGGPGRYSLWLAERGYTVHHRDLIDLHREQVAADAAARGVTIDSAIADARALDLPDASVDAALLLGPIYHLPTLPTAWPPSSRRGGSSGPEARSSPWRSRVGPRGCTARSRSSNR